jgi:hypothetical protein
MIPANGAAVWSAAAREVGAAARVAVLFNWRGRAGAHKGRPYDLSDIHLQPRPYRQPAHRSMTIRNIT